MDKAKIQVK